MNETVQWYLKQIIAGPEYGHEVITSDQLIEFDLKTFNLVGITLKKKKNNYCHVTDTN